MKHCPVCGHHPNREDQQCSECGVIFSKYFASGHSTKRHLPKSAKWLSFCLIGILIFISGVLVGPRIHKLTANPQESSVNTDAEKEDEPQAFMPSERQLDAYKSYLMTLKGIQRRRPVEYDVGHLDCPYNVITYTGKSEKIRSVYISVDTRNYAYVRLLFLGLRLNDRNRTSVDVIFPEQSRVVLIKLLKKGKRWNSERNIGLRVEKKLGSVPCLVEFANNFGDALNADLEVMFVRGSNDSSIRFNVLGQQIANYNRVPHTYSFVSENGCSVNSLISMLQRALIKAASHYYAEQQLE